MRNAKVRAVHLDKHFYLVMAPKSFQHNPDKHKVMPARLMRHPIVSVHGSCLLCWSWMRKGRAMHLRSGALCRFTDVSRKMSTAGSSVMS